jgi:single-strand DNA-binding protein
MNTNHEKKGPPMPEPPPPELLEQLGIEPHSTCSGGQQPQPERATAQHDVARTADQIIKPTSAKENPMRDIATATLSGNLTRDVELRTLPSGTEVARLRVASSTRRRQGEEWVEKSNYFTVEAYGSQARACAEYLSKGSRVVVDAELDWREWTDPQNNKREAVVLRARQVVFEGHRTRTDASQVSPEDDGSSLPRVQPGDPATTATQLAEAAAGADDLPF